jgi:CubicO group peptidase (beta-lactamase class C family)
MTGTVAQPTRDWTFDADTRARVDAIFQQWNSPTTPGMALGIYREGEIIHTSGYGMSNLEHGIPIEPGSIFHIASISKQFTDTCVALLAAEGALDVDDDVRRYVPEVPEFGPVITLRHLIHHVSGLRDQWMLLRLSGWRQEDLVTEDDVLDLLKRQRALNFQPNDEYFYSNTGYTLLAITIKRVSGRTLRQFAQERIFGPLGMTSTHFHDDHSEIVKGRTQAYQPRKGGGYHISIPVFDVVGTTSLFTTVEDLAKWDANFTSEQVGGPAIIEQIQTPGTFNDGKPMTYAWGLMTGTYRGARRIGHSGADHGYRAEYLRLPEFGLAVSVLSNVSDSNPAQRAEQVVNAIIGDRLAPDVHPAAATRTSTHAGIPAIVPPAAIAGTYHNASRNSYLSITSKDGKASLDMSEPMALTALGNGRFVSEGNWFTITASSLDGNGLASSLEVITRGVDDPGTFTRLSPISLEPDALAVYTGTYWSDELATAYEIVADRVAGTLAVRRRKFEDETLTPLARDVFGRGSLDFGLVVAFQRDRKGQVTGFEYTASRTRNLSFSRSST